MIKKGAFQITDTDYSPIEFINKTKEETEFVKNRIFEDLDKLDQQSIESLPIMGLRETLKNVAVKNDAGKPDFSHISWELMEAVAKVREFGAKKYARNNWKLGFKYTRSIAACLRHIFAFLRGENTDPESGLSHVAHAICNLEHLLYDIAHRPENDDR